MREKYIALGAVIDRKIRVLKRVTLEAEIMAKFKLTFPLDISFIFSGYPILKGKTIKPNLQKLTKKEK